MSQTVTVCLGEEPINVSPPKHITLASMLLSQGYLNKVAQTGWLKTNVLSQSSGAWKSDITVSGPRSLQTL